MSNVKEYCYEDAVEFIHLKTGIDYEVIYNVLMIELEYMNTIGLVENYENDDWEGK